MCRTKKLPDEETTRFTSRPKRFTRHLLQLYTTGIRCVKNHNIYRVPVLVLLWYSVPGVQICCDRFFVVLNFQHARSTGVQDTFVRVPKIRRAVRKAGRDLQQDEKFGDRYTEISAELDQLSGSLLGVCTATEYASYSFLFLLFFFFFFNFFDPIYYLRPSILSLLLIVVTQIRGHVAGSSPPLYPPRFVPCILSREDLSSFSPRRVASNCAYPRALSS